MYIVVSKLKKLGKDNQVNTAASVADTLSRHVEELFKKAVEVAKKDGRKTVMDRDLKAVSSSIEQMLFDDQAKVD